MSRWLLLRPLHFVIRHDYLSEGLLLSPRTERPRALSEGNLQLLSEGDVTFFMQELPCRHCLRRGGNC